MTKYSITTLVFTGFYFNSSLKHNPVPVESEQKYTFSEQIHIIYKVEHVSSNAKVVGSIPREHMNWFKKYIYLLRNLVLQLKYLCSKNRNLHNLVRILKTDLDNYVYN